MERAMGVEPTSKAWEALVLPMNYARIKAAAKSGGLVTRRGFEPLDASVKGW